MAVPILPSAAPIPPDAAAKPPPVTAPTPPDAAAKPPPATVPIPPDAAAKPPPITAPTPPDAPPATAPIPSEFAAKLPEINYLDLPCPIPFEEIHREVITCLRPEEFIEGMRHDLVKRCNDKFCISNSIMMGHTVISSPSSKIIKTPTTNYEFGANYTDSKLMLLGRMTMDGKLNANVKYDFTHNLTLKANAQLTNEPHKSHGLINFEYKGHYYRAQLLMGSGALLGATCIESVSPHLSVGSEFFWAGRHGKYTFGHALRYNSNKMVSTAHFNGSGMVTLSYVHKASEKVHLVSEFIYNSMSKDATTSFGYDYKLREGRVRAKIDSKGVVACLLQQNDGYSFSFEIDYKKQDHKLGFRLSWPRLMNSFNFN